MSDVACGIFVIEIFDRRGVCYRFAFDRIDSVDIQSHRILAVCLFATYNELNGTRTVLLDKTALDGEIVRVPTVHHWHPCLLIVNELEIHFRRIDGIGTLHVRLDGDIIVCRVTRPNGIGNRFPNADRRPFAHAV